MTESNNRSEKVDPDEKYRAIAEKIVEESSIGRWENPRSIILYKLGIQALLKLADQKHKGKWNKATKRTFEVALRDNPYDEDEKPLVKLVDFVVQNSGVDRKSVANGIFAGFDLAIKYMSTDTFKPQEPVEVTRDELRSVRKAR